MILKQASNGGLYLARKTTKRGTSKNVDRNSKSSQTYKLKTYRDWWLVKISGTNGVVFFGGLVTVVLPSQFIGKKVRFRLEVIEDEVEK